MSYVKVTVERAGRRCSSFVATRDRADVPLVEEDVINTLVAVATDLFYLVLGYPERDYLEQTDLWRPDTDGVLGGGK